MRPITYTMTPSAASANNIALSQSVSGASLVTLTALAGTGLENARIIGITSAADDHLITFTVTGTDADGNIISNVVTGASGAPGTAVTTSFFKTITSIKTSGSTAGAITVGTVGTTLSSTSQTLPLNYYAREQIQVAIKVTGTINYSVQETFDDIYGLPANRAIWFAGPTALTAATSNQHALLDLATVGMRIEINSYSTGATLVARIISASNSDEG